MNLGLLKNHLESLPDGSTFSYSLSDPFSWRGSYDEVAFAIEEKASTKEDLLDKVNQALSEEFIGWKGGEYYYNGSTPVNFEAEHRDYTDGEYTEGWISELLGLNHATSPEHRLTLLLFKA